MVKDLYFRTNSRHIGQLGRELVTDFVTALVELVKNAYDADAGSVQIILEHSGTPQSRIVIVDTGTGMTQDEFENKWMVIGTGNKLSDPYTKKNRKKTGKKGIGRFSVERLAERVTIYSYSERDNFKVNINWNLYEEISIIGLKQRIQILRNKSDVAAAKYIANQIEYYLSLPLKDEEADDKKYAAEQRFVSHQVGKVISDYQSAFENDFLDILEVAILPIMAKQEKVELNLEEIKIPLESIDTRETEESFGFIRDLHEKEKCRKGEKTDDIPATGMVMVLDCLRDNWRQRDIDKLQKELRLLVAPEFIEKDPFYIELIADQFEIPEEISVNSILDLNFAKICAKIYDNGTKSEIIYTDQDHKDPKYVRKSYDVPLLCGDIDFELYYYLRDSAHMQNETYNYRFALQVLDVYCGIKIYRDNFRVKPYGDLGNDWLELDKSKVRDTHGYRVGNNQTIGVIKISDEKNPLLIDATNREGIIENEAYEQLRNFVLECIDLISSVRKKAYEKSKSELDKAKQEKKSYDKKTSEHRIKQNKHIEYISSLVQKQASYKLIAESLEKLNQDEEKFQKEKEKTYDRMQDAYEKRLEYQETELSMYKNLATLGILAGNFGHETQDIISRIQGSLAFYKDLAEAYNNVHVQRVTKNLESDFSRISGYSKMIVDFLRKKKRETQKNLDFKSVLENICLLYKNLLDAFGVDFAWGSDENIYMTMRQIDLESIIVNMITNAFEQVKTKPEKKINIYFKQQDTDIYLYFDDNGNGVPLELREWIFQAFHTTKEDDGIGLGLNIVHDIVFAYGGTAYVTDSDILGGARFVVHFQKSEELS